MLNLLVKYFKNDIKSKFIVIFSSLIIFLLSYTHALTNEIAFHDNVWIESMGATFTSGRFSIAIIYGLFKLFLGYRFITTPVIDGVITFLFITMCSYIIVKLLNIKNNILVALISFLMMANTVVGSIMATRYCAIAYSISLLIGVYSVYLYSKKNNNLIICALLLAFSIGIYQAFISFFISLSVLYIIKISYEKNYDIKKSFTMITKYLLLFFISIIIYFVIMKISLMLSGEELSSYKGANVLANINIFEYLNRLLYAYKCYFKVDEGAPFFPFRSDILYYLMFIISILLFIKNKIKLSAGTALTLLLFPIAVNSNAIMFGIENYNYSFMGLSIVFQFFIIIYFIDLNINKFIKYKSSILLLILYLLVVFNNVYLINLSSLKAEFTQSQAKSYFTNLINRIESIDGYDKNMAVCFVNDRKKDTSVYNGTLPDFDGIKNFIFIYEMDFDEVINDYAWRRFMKLWTGYDPKVISDNEIKDKTYVKNMPIYPKNGSIKIIDNVIVVKFGDE